MTPDIAALRAALERATPGEWTTDEDYPALVYCDDATGSVVARCAGRGFETVSRTYTEQIANADLIALLKNNAPVLLAAWEELKARRDFEDTVCKDEPMDEVLVEAGLKLHGVWGKWDIARVIAKEMRAAAFNLDRFKLMLAERERFAADKLTAERERDEAKAALIAAWEERERLRKALEPFAQFAARFGPYARDDDWQLTRNPSGDGNLTMGDVRAAYRSLHPTQEPRDAG